MMVLKEGMSNIDLEEQQQQNGFPMKRLKGCRSAQTEEQGKESGVSYGLKLFAVSCTISMAVDPLFLFIAAVDYNKKCFEWDRALMIVVCVLRSLIDSSYIFHMVKPFLTGSCKRYSSPYFIFDIFSALPLPQVVFFTVPRVDSSVAWNLCVPIIPQYIVRFVKLLLLYKKIQRKSRRALENTWVGLALSLFLCLLSMNLLGGFWYLFALQRLDKCWHISCKAVNNCPDSFYCKPLNGKPRTGDYSFLNSTCLLLEQPTDSDFDFGIYLEALRSKMVKNKKFWNKYVRCFWWALRNSSSLGQGLTTSDYILENLFAILVSFSGLFMFAFVIFHFQSYVQTLNVRIKQVQGQVRDRKNTEEWMKRRNLPVDLQHRIRKYKQHKWKVTRGIDEEGLIKSLPKDLRGDINCNIYWPLLKRVPIFESLNDESLEAMCDRLKPVFYTKNAFIYRKHEPVDAMLFIDRGKLSMTTGGSSDWCGEELIAWAINPNSSSTLPTSTTEIKTMEDVQGFALRADDLKFAVSQVSQADLQRLRQIYGF